MDDLNDQRTEPLLESLSDRECEVLNGLAQGLSNREIGHQLSLALSTVKWYINQINQKLGTRNRKEIVNRAQRLGLLDEDNAESAPPKHNLPHQTTIFVGRNAELDEIYALLTNPDVRLLTILAPGGMGKTRLALEAAAQQLYNFENGVYFVPLQALSAPEHIIQQIATSAGYQSTHDGHDPKQQVLAYLANKQMLLVLDSFEHLLGGAVLINEILRAAPDVKVLATSRERLNLSGETVYGLRGMQFPAGQIADALEYDAVELLVQAARRVKPDWALTEANLEDVACVCRLTQGMPLAIVLAASWLDVYALDRICAEVQHSADILQTDMRDVPERLRSVRAVFDYSWERLQPAEQKVFMKMSVFRGGCTPRAAEHVTGANPHILQALVNKALLTQNQSGRFDIHELLRQYAEEHLEASGEAETVRDAHMHYYADMMYEREADLKGRHQIEALNEIETDFENVRAVWRWALQQHHYESIERMVGAIERFVSMRTRLQEGDELFSEAIRMLTRTSDEARQRLLAKVQGCEGRIICGMGGYERAEALLRKSLAVARKYNDLRELARCLWGLSRSKASQGQLMEALPLAEESLSLFSKARDKWGEASLHFFIGYLAVGLGHSEKGHQHTLQAYHMCNEIGDKVGQAAALNHLGVLAASNGNWKLSEQRHRESLALRRKIGNPTSIASSLSNMAGTALTQGRFEEAEQLNTEALAVASEINIADVTAPLIRRLSRIAEFNANYKEAHRLAEEAYAYAQTSGNWSTILNANQRLAWVLCCLEAYDEATGYLLTALEQYLQVRSLPDILDAVAGFALIVAYQSQSERAAELLGLVFQHPIQLKWLEKHPRLTKLRQDLQTELGEEVYNAAWERGKSLDVETVAQELLAEFGDGT